MKHWLYPANPKYYRIFEAFSLDNTYWPISTNVEVGDLVYIYLSAPHKQIGYLCEVEEIGIDLPEIEDKIKPYFISSPSKCFMDLSISEFMACSKGLDSFSIRSNSIIETTLCMDCTTKITMFSCL